MYKRTDIINTDHKKHGLFIIRINIVDIITLSGVLLSSISIALMLRGDLELSLGVLYLAVIADAFDGILARQLKVERDFGRYLDGFVDALDYLIAPALFVFLWGFNQWYQGLLLVFFIMCGFIRLSVFNQVGNISEANNNLCYWGAPVFWSTLLLGPIFIAKWFFDEVIIFNILLLAIPLFSFMMLHNGRYYKFKNPLLMLTGLLVLSLIFLIKGHDTLSLHLVTALLLIVPLVFAGILHMVVVKNDYLQSLALPISLVLFGASKTWRGIIFMPLFTILGFYMLYLLFDINYLNLSFNMGDHTPFSLGIMLGLAYVLAELPNSFIKRRIGIPAGGTPQQNKMAFIIGDQLDSVIGCGLVYVIGFGVPVATFICLVTLGAYIAFVVKSALFHFGYKKTAA